MAEEIVDRELGWNDEISNDGNEFVLLEPGEYRFEVKTFERARHTGSAKLPACNKAVLSFAILDESGNVLATIQKHNLFLHSKTEGMVCAFFRAIGARKHGEKLKMDWNTVIGACGRCVIEIKELDSTKKPGEKFKMNQIKRFLDAPEESKDIPF